MFAVEESCSLYSSAKSSHFRCPLAGTVNIDCDFINLFGPQAINSFVHVSETWWADSIVSGGNPMDFCGFCLVWFRPCFVLFRYFGEGKSSREICGAVAVFFFVVFVFEAKVFHCFAHRTEPLSEIGRKRGKKIVF